MTNDSLVLVFEFLDVVDIRNVLQVSKSWYKSANEPRVWSSLCLRDQRFVVTQVLLFSYLLIFSFREIYNNLLSRQNNFIKRNTEYGKMFKIYNLLLTKRKNPETIVPSKQCNILTFFSYRKSFSHSKNSPFQQF